jgi:hypothetical protein
MNSASEPSVDVLTAEVRVLQVGSRPIALSARAPARRAGPWQVSLRAAARTGHSASEVLRAIAAAKDAPESAILLEMAEFLATPTT